MTSFEDNMPFKIAKRWPPSLHFFKSHLYHLELIVKGSSCFYARLKLKLFQQVILETNIIKQCNHLSLIDLALKNNDKKAAIHYLQLLKEHVNQQTATLLLQNRLLQAKYATKQNLGDLDKLPPDVKQQIAVMLYLNV